MSKAVKAQVAKAVQAFKKGVDKRNVNNTAGEIASFIEEQIELKEGEVKVLNKEIDKYGEQNKRDFIETLAVFDEDSITDVKGREEYAQRYVLNGLELMNENKKFIADKKAEITVLEQDISDLNEFSTTLTELAGSIEDSIETEE